MGAYRALFSLCRRTTERDLESPRPDSAQRRGAPLQLRSGVNLMAGSQRQNDILEQTRRFWNASPCGGQDSFHQRFEHRYDVEPWVIDILRSIAATHHRVLEIGCGQGTDGIVLCSLLPRGGSYLGLDYSDDSVRSARASAEQAREMLTLNLEPAFRTANAEALDLPDASASCVYSNGVLHHTANPVRAFEEVWRVLQPGGDAYLTLYRKPSLRVGLAKALRAVQTAVDLASGGDRRFYRLIEHRSTPPLLGTMLLEGLGVPMMEWYSAADIRSVFGKWVILRLAPVGCNIPRRKPRSRGWTAGGYLWFVHLRKPLGSSVNEHSDNAVRPTRSK
jgi:ubiquinone/menaquinone biosynthesis C-methylase UbiE